MNLDVRLDAFTQLGSWLSDQFIQDYNDVVELAVKKNAWFTIENINAVLQYWGRKLNHDVLLAWLDPYKLISTINSKSVLVVMAGNIPLVGFHDLLAVLISGHRVVIKMSTNDNLILPVIVDKLISISPGFRKKIEFIGKVQKRKFDAVIATGSDNSSKYFEYYFADSKNIIRKNRRSLAILTGDESSKELEGLSYDIFSNFGLGCRNVSKLFLPEDFDMDLLFQEFYRYRSVLMHKKYANNYDYNKTLFLMGKHEFIENGFLLLKEEESLFSPVSVLYYEFYSDRHVVDEFIENNNQLQCVVSKGHVPFGHSQNPDLWDYADGVDTINFLRDI